MKPDDRVRALNAATVHLTWLTEKPYDRCTTALRLLADVDARATIAAGSRDDTGRRAVGGHSDPTAAAAGARVDAGASSRKDSDAIRYDVRELCELAAFLRFEVCGCPSSPTVVPSLRSALFNIGWTLTIPHSIGAWSSDDPETVREVDHAVDRMAQLSSILATRVRRVLSAAVRPPSEKPVQKALAGCESCARDQGYFEPVAEGRYAKLCRTCGDYKGTMKRNLPVGAVVYMHRHGKLTQKAIDDALRAEKAPERRRIRA
jgi:hypothetical protein